MGHNDWSELRPELPPAAGDQSDLGFEPDNEWLKTAEPELRQEAMRTWFLTRYWDPANDTPYNSRDGYIYIHGGPYDAQEELENRFGHLCPEEAILAVKEDVEQNGIVDWAPMHHEQDYDDAFEFEANARDDPYRFFLLRLGEVDGLAEESVHLVQQATLRQLLFGHLIAALEAYLADTMLYWVAADKGVFRRLVSTSEKFTQMKIATSEIFDRLDTLENDVEEHLQNVVWHRLDRVQPMLTGALKIQTPDIGDLMKHIIVRHDIVHRGGRTKEGSLVVVSADNLWRLRNEVIAFVEELEGQLKKQFPSE